MSAVIPTHRRPKLVVRAIESVLRQSYSPIETIVVIDGKDQETRDVVEALRQPSVTCIETGYHAGPAEARNVGVRAAKGAYVGLLDDDDEWADDKIARQMQIVDDHSLAGGEFIVSCRSQYRLPDGRNVVFPSTVYQTPADLAEYMFYRRSPIARPGFVTSGSVLTPRSLALRVPFPTDSAHEDLSWLLLCVSRDGVPLVMAEEALFIYHADPLAANRAHTQSWRASLAWARKYRAHISPKAFAGLVSSTTALRAKRQEGTLRLFEIAHAMLREGHCQPVHWLTLGGIALLPLGAIDKWRQRRR